MSVPRIRKSQLSFYFSVKRDIAFIEGKILLSFPFPDDEKITGHFAPGSCSSQLG